MTVKGSGKNSGNGSHWKCFGCQYWVPKGKYFCNGCGHQPPAHISQCSSKGSGKGKGKSNENTTAREVKPSNPNVAKGEEAKKKWDKREKELLEKIKSLEANKGQEKADDSKDNGMAVDETSAAAKQGVARLQAEVDELQNMSA